ncbi:MAG: YciI family protein [Ornithinibacter sp.]
MAKYLMLKHYRGGPAAINDVPMSEWTSQEVDDHVKFMDDFADELRESGEFVDAQALSPDGMWVRFDGEGAPPVVDGPFAETKDLIAGWMVIDVDSRDRAVELAGKLSAAPAAGGRPLGEWLELRPFLDDRPNAAE